MNKIEFIPGMDNGVPWGDPSDNEAIRRLIYMRLLYAGSCSFSGWVTPEVYKLICAAPDLLDALSDLERAVSAHFAHVIGDAVPPELRDINDRVMAARAVIAKATGEQP